MHGPVASERLRSLVEGAASVASQTDLQAVLANAVETAIELTGARYGALGVLDDHGGLADFVYRGLEPDEAMRIGRLPSGEGILGLVSRHGETLRLDDVASHPDSAGFPPGHPEMRTFLGVPIRAGNARFGNLYLTDKPGGFTEEDEVLVEALAMVVGAAVRTVELQERLRRLAIVEERERIAMELHDGIVQVLFAVGLSLQAQAARVDDPLVEDALLADAARLDEAVATLRKFIFQLPTDEPEIDLRTEIGDLITSLAGPYDVAVEVSYTGDLVGLSPELCHDVRQFVAEAVSNALRHADTDRIVVRIDAGAPGLTIEVRDEGTGFDPAAAVWGSGIANLRQRAEKLGGSLELHSRLGEGTVVRATLPR